jgi:hypothetical protein
VDGNGEQAGRSPKTPKTDEEKELQEAIRVSLEEHKRRQEVSRNLTFILY